MAPRTAPLDEESAPATLPNDPPATTSGSPPPALNTATRKLYDSMVKAASEDLVYNSKGNTTVNLATLQRMILFHLQVEITEHTSQLANRKFEENNPLDKLKPLLADYVQAVRNWETMAEYQAKSGGDPLRDPFCISSKWKLAGDAIANAKLRVQGTYATSKLDSQIGTFGQRSRTNKGRHLAAFLNRFAMALFGGVALIAPMLLMVLHKDRTTDLSTTSVAVFLFAIVVAYYSEAAPEAVISAVAAYAAVLVVFVGTLQ